MNGSLNATKVILSEPEDLGKNSCNVQIIQMFSLDLLLNWNLGLNIRTVDLSAANSTFCP